MFATYGAMSKLKKMIQGVVLSLLLASISFAGEVEVNRMVAIEVLPSSLGITQAAAFFFLQSM